MSFLRLFETGYNSLNYFRDGCASRSWFRPENDHLDTIYEQIKRARSRVLSHLNEACIDYNFRSEASRIARDPAPKGQGLQQDGEQAGPRFKWLWITFSRRAPDRMTGRTDRGLYITDETFPVSGVRCPAAIRPRCACWITSIASSKRQSLISSGSPTLPTLRPGPALSSWPSCRRYVRRIVGWRFSRTAYASFVLNGTTGPAGQARRARATATGALNSPRLTDRAPGGSGRGAFSRQLDNSKPSTVSTRAR